VKYSEFLDYLKTLGESHVNVKSVVMGDYEEILEMERTTIDYPCLWIETPSVIYQGDNDSVRQIYQGSLVVLHNNAAVHDPETARANLESTFDLAREILWRMTVHDNLFDIRGVRMDAIATLGNDNDQGWRFEFQIETDVTDDDCYIETNWT